MTTDVKSLYGWRALKRRDCSVLMTLNEQWSRLLSDTKTTEPDISKFLKSNAGFFFCNGAGKLVCAAELELGASLRPDFVVTEDRGTAGFFYNLIELESPHDDVYTSGRRPSAHLSAAIEQVHAWQRWLRENISYAKKLFPSHEFTQTGRPPFNYTIIIGRRKCAEFETNRNHLADSLDIAIRSFDSLTDAFISRDYPAIAHIFSTESSLLDLRIRNELANPFVTAYSSATWRGLIEDRRFQNRHMISNNAAMLLEVRTINERFDEFANYWRGLSAEDKDPHFEEMRWTARP